WLILKPHATTFFRSMRLNRFMWPEEDGIPGVSRAHQLSRNCCQHLHESGDHFGIDGVRSSVVRIVEERVLADYRHVPSTPMDPLSFTPGASCRAARGDRSGDLLPSSPSPRSPPIDRLTTAESTSS